MVEPSEKTNLTVQLESIDFKDILFGPKCWGIASPSRDEIESAQIQGAALLERQALELFYDVAVQLSGGYQSIQILNDNHFWPNRDKIGLDVHAYFEIAQDRYFHLRAYVKHMLQHFQEAQTGVFLTAYLKDGVHANGGTHALSQSWYPWDAQVISLKIREENPQIFTGFE